jgi:hypothetical protein
MDRKSAEMAVRQARKNAESALATAARMAAAAGLDFNVPQGFQVDLNGVIKVRSDRTWRSCSHTHMCSRSCL